MCIFWTMFLRTSFSSDYAIRPVFFQFKGVLHDSPSIVSPSLPLVTDFRFFLSTAKEWELMDWNSRWEYKWVTLVIRLSRSWDEQRVEVFEITGLAHFTWFVNILDSSIVNLPCSELWEILCRALGVISFDDCSVIIYHSWYSFYFRPARLRILSFGPVGEKFLILDE